MIRWLRAVIVTVLFALLGAAAGRVVAEQRRRAESGEEGPSGLDVALELPRPQEVVPGLVAALRVGDRPWSFLHIPPWGAAFAVNFAVTAMGRELQPLVREFSGDVGGFGFGREREPWAPSVETVVVDGHGAGDDADGAGVGGGASPPEGFVPFED